MDEATLRTLRETHVLPPTFTKEAGRRMPPDTERWSEAVFETFAEQHPELAEMSSGDVEWNQDSMDTESGNAVGVIPVQSGQNLITVPVVVSDFELRPMDIFMDDGKMHLINNENIGFALKEQDSIGEVAYPERSEFRSGEFKEWLKQAMPSQTVYNRSYERLEKLARAYRPFLQETLQGWRDVNVPSSDGYSVYYVEKGASLGTYALTRYQDGQVKESDRITLTSARLQQMPELHEAVKLAQEHGSAVMPVGYADERRIGFVDIFDEQTSTPIKEAGLYTGKRVGRDGLDDVTVLALQRRNLGSPKTAAGNEMIYIVNDGDSLAFTHQRSVIGEATGTEKFACEDMMCPMSDADRHQRGVVLYDSGGDDIIQSSEPLTVDRVEVTPQGRIRIYFRNDGAKIHYLVEPALKEVQRLPESDPYYAKQASVNCIGPDLMFLSVPDTTTLVKTAHEQQLHYNRQILNRVEETPDMLVKQADWSEQANPTIHAVHGRRQYEDPPHRFMARMMSLGVDPEKTASLLSAIQDREVRVVGIPLQVTPEQAPLPTEKVAHVARVARDVRQDLVKAAAGLMAGGMEDDSERLLGASMLDEENIRSFVEVIPALEETSSSLAHLLYAARTGKINLDEDVVKSALINLTKIVSALRDLSAHV